MVKQISCKYSAAEFLKIRRSRIPADKMKINLCKHGEAKPLQKW